MIALIIIGYLVAFFVTLKLLKTQAKKANSHVTKEDKKGFIIFALFCPLTLPVLFVMFLFDAILLVYEKL